MKQYAIAALYLYTTWSGWYSVINYQEPVNLIPFVVWLLWTLAGVVGVKRFLSAPIRGCHTFRIIDPRTGTSPSDFITVKLREFIAAGDFGGMPFHDSSRQIGDDWSTGLSPSALAVISRMTGKYLQLPSGAHLYSYYDTSNYDKLCSEMERRCRASDAVAFHVRLETQEILMLAVAHAVQDGDVTTLELARLSGFVKQIAGEIQDGLYVVKSAHMANYMLHRYRLGPVRTFIEAYVEGAVYGLRTRT